MAVYIDSSSLMYNTGFFHASLQQIFEWMEERFWKVPVAIHSTRLTIHPFITPESRVAITDCQPTPETTSPCPHRISSSSTSLSLSLKSLRSTEQIRPIFATLVLRVVGHFTHVLRIQSSANGWKRKKGGGALTPELPRDFSTRGRYCGDSSANPFSSSVLRSRSGEA